MNGSKFVLFALCLVLFLACSDVGVIDPYARAGAPASSSSSGVVFEPCGALLFNPATHFCFNGTPYELCGGTEDYDPPTEYCFNDSKVTPKCGARTERFDPDLYECRDGGKIYLKAKLKDDDDNEYEAVLIGSQTWMAENLNVAADGSVCYENEPDNCIKFGSLYDWATAMEICPEGWHLPSEAEWNTLTQTVGGTGAPNYLDGAAAPLTATSDWKPSEALIGTDTYGFAALPGGYMRENGTFYGNGDEFGGWWSSTEGISSAWRRRIMYSNSNVGRASDLSNLIKMSVRCVKDGE